MTTDDKCEHRYVQAVISPDTGEGYARCTDCGEKVEGIDVAQVSPELQKAIDAIDGIDIPAFTPEDTRAIASLPLGLIKPVVSEAQFNALAKFVNINQMVTGLVTGKVNHA